MAGSNTDETIRILLENEKKETYRKAKQMFKMHQEGRNFQEIAEQVGENIDIVRELLGDIYTTMSILFNQEQVTRMMIESEKREAREKARAEARAEAEKEAKREAGSIGYAKAKLVYKLHFAGKSDSEIAEETGVSIAKVQDMLSDWN